ncbi:four-carbon acid sugar kinase family protein [Bradyrhizobium sp. dw_78]|uniref:four-carbon acid sugar kinase family protein n=1 Tax=Bradyrhizobium sp. dw_78 TaxID=2719793 RepID=UPI001BD2163D|nr:four-carbon acid sugar kinase family protein [Bradyrhizobium sp. dw_78]
MPSLRLLADDLTGALDTSAEFVGAFGPLDVLWSAVAAPAEEVSFCIDSGTREAHAEHASAVVRPLAPLLHGGGIAYKKIDSLLRGPWAAEIAACLQTGFWDSCIVAPAFAHQGRRTRAGQQYARASDGSWNAVGENIIRELRRHNLDAQPGRLDTALPPGVSVFDAETDDDLDRIVRIGRSYGGKVLWCGTGGLAGALARGTEVSASRQLKRPLLGVFGSDHATTDAQLAMCRSVVVQGTGGRTEIDQVRRGLDDGVALVKLEAPEASSRAEAAQFFEQEIIRLSLAIDPPGTLMIAGGETLKAQCLAVGARALKVLGRLEPGVPRSVLQGGAWAGVDVISKSGAFGPPDLGWKLLNENKLI